jgi:dihydropteroate synthase
MRALVMGVLNVTPDSFFDGGRFFSHEAAVARGVEMVAEGADIVDIGGESSRPGAEPVTEADELQRVVPVIEALSPQVRVSIDTTKASVAEAAVRAGATLVNDISASLHEVAAAQGVGWVAMHMRGTPRTMQHDPQYEDVVGEVAAFLEERAEAALAAGVSEVWVDPGIGFGKTPEHNLSLLRHLGRLVAIGHPVMVGASRKSFLGRLTGDGGGLLPVEERLPASLATAVWAMANGAGMVRVHDVVATRQAAMVVGNAGPGGRPGSEAGPGGRPGSEDGPGGRPGSEDAA